MNKFTPGPWQILPQEADKNYIRIRGTVMGSRYKIANVHNEKFANVGEIVRERELQESIANAHLIVAAPKILKALERITRRFVVEDAEDQKLISDCDSLILEARGETA